MRRSTLVHRYFISSLVVSCLAIVGSAPSARAERLFLPLDREGSWLASDKTLHFAGSFALAASLRIQGQEEGAALGMTFGVGMAKEIYDAAFKPARCGRGASRKDLVVDLLGAAAGILFIRAVDR